MQFTSALTAAVVALAMASPAAAAAEDLSAMIYSTDDCSGQGESKTWSGDLGSESDCIPIDGFQSYNLDPPSNGGACSMKIFPNNNCDANSRWQYLAATGQCMQSGGIGSVKLSCRVKEDKSPADTSSSSAAAAAAAKRTATPTAKRMRV